MTSLTPQKPGASRMCAAPGKGAQDTCRHPRVESAESALCARHLLIAANDVKQIGGGYLASVVRTEEGR